MNSRWRSVIGETPVASSSSLIDEMMRTSCPSSEIHIGIGVPQKRLRLTAQSRALASQLWKRFSLTKLGTQYVLSLFASSRVLSASTLMKVPGTAR